MKGVFVAAGWRRWPDAKVERRRRVYGPMVHALDFELTTLDGCSTGDRGPRRRLIPGLVAPNRGHFVPLVSAPSCPRPEPDERDESIRARSWR